MQDTYYKDCIFRIILPKITIWGERNTDLGKAIDPQMTVSSERSNDIEKNFTAKKNCTAFSLVCLCVYVLCVFFVVVFWVYNTGSCFCWNLQSHVYK